MDLRSTKIPVYFLETITHETIHQFFWFMQIKVSNANGIKMC
jgi:hypothetical protein